MAFRTTTMRASWALVAVTLGLVTTPAYAAPGDLDETFGSDGFQPAPQPTSPAAIALQGHGGPVAAGMTEVSGQRYASVAAYTESGLVDTAFGNAGTVTLALGESRPAGSNPASSLRDVAVQSDGSILAAGSIAVSADEPTEDWLVVRLLPSGSPDPAFSGDGILTTDLGGTATAVSVDPVGRPVIAGRGAVVRLNADGSFDQSLSGDGQQGGLPFFPTALDLLPDGSVIVGGSRRSDEVSIAKLKPDGEFDADFGSGGVASFPNTDRMGGGGLGDLAVDDEGAIIASAYNCPGIQLGPGAGQAACADSLIRIDPRGAQDAAFADVGELRQERGNSSVAVHSERILRSGTASPPDQLGSAAVVRSSTPGGAPDQTFGQSGTAYLFEGFRGGATSDLVVGPDAKITALLSSPPARLSRLTLDDSPRDSDADGVLNSDDLCDLFHSERRRGCPRVPRTAELLREQDGDLKVRLRAVLTSCYRHERGALKRVTRGRDETVNRFRVDYSGWTVPRATAPGRYYAVFAAHVSEGSGFCERTRTRSRRHRTG